MGLKRHIPNLLTLGNVLFGVIAILHIISSPRAWDSSSWLLLCIGISFVCDFLDGFAARALGVSGPMGKELDSLADMVTFGVLPGVLAYLILQETLPPDYAWLRYGGLVVTLFSALRLAKFNLDTRQSHGFLGLPTPANALWILSLFLIHRRAYNGPAPGTEFLPALTDLLAYLCHPAVFLPLMLLSSLLLVSEFPLLALKFKGFGLRENALRYLLIVSAALLIGLLRERGVPLFMLVYFLLSSVDTLQRRRAGETAP